MSPVLQVIIGELIGVAIFLGMLRLSSLFDSISSLVVLIVGSVVLVAVFAYFYMGGQNLYYHNVWRVAVYSYGLCDFLYFWACNSRFYWFWFFNFLFSVFDYSICAYRFGMFLQSYSKCNSIVIKSEVLPHFFVGLHTYFPFEI